MKMAPATMTPDEAPMLWIMTFSPRAPLRLAAVLKPTAMIAMGMAASMGSIILSSGAKGKRMALPSARIMIHQPLGGAQGQATDIELEAKEILRMKEMLTGILAENSGQDIEKVKKDCERDYYMSAEEAVKYGLIDKVITAEELKN